MTAAQASATVSAEALLAAELEVAAAAKALASGQASLAVAQKAVAVATDIGTVAMNIFKIAMISTGIGALVVALGSVVAYFSSTREGANKLKVIMAEVGAVVKVLIDRFSSFGEGIVKFLTGDFDGSAKAMKGVFSGIATEMVEEATAAGILERRTQALNTQERENRMLQQERMTRASQLRADAKEEGVTGADRLKMVSEAKSLLIAFYAEEKEVAKGRYEIMKEQLKDKKNTTEQLNELKDAEIAVSKIDQDSADAIKALSRERKAATKAIETETDAIIKKAEAQRKADQVGLNMNLGHAVGLKSKSEPVSFLAVDDGNQKLTEEHLKTQNKIIAGNNKEMMSAKNLTRTYQVTDALMAKNKKAIDATKRTYLDLSSTIQGSLNDLAVGTGEFFGGLLVGEGSLKSFGDMIAGVFGNLATNIGKQMIAFGTAGIALKVMIKNPWLSVAAGVALVAIGNAATKSIGNSISGGGSGGGQNFNYDTRSSTPTASAQKVNVVVSGTLNASAKGLTTTLNNENTRVAVST